MKPATTTYIIILLIMLSYSMMTSAQGIQVGEVMILSTSAWKENPGAIKPKVRKQLNDESAVQLRLFQADRGNRKGDFLLACTMQKDTYRKSLSPGSPFTDDVTSFGDADSMKPSIYLSDPSAYTEYRLLGAQALGALPTVKLLGLHYIKVRKDRAADFEKFVVEKLHPAVGNVLPDMHLLYYKAVAGDNAGSYITLFAIESYEAREKYWPTGNPETDILKQAFLPLRGLGRELAPYLAEGSYLEESGGAAAYFESKEWTDFLVSGN